MILLCQASRKLSKYHRLVMEEGASAIKIWRPTWWLNLCSPAPLKLHKPAKAASVARKMRSAVVSLSSILLVSRPTWYWYSLVFHDIWYQTHFQDRLISIPVLLWQAFLVVPRAEGTVALTIGTTTLSATTVSGENEWKKHMPAGVCSCRSQAAWSERGPSFGQRCLSSAWNKERQEKSKKGLKFFFSSWYAVVHITMHIGTTPCSPQSNGTRLPDTIEIHIALNFGEHLRPQDIIF